MQILIALAIVLCVPWPLVAGDIGLKTPTGTYAASPPDIFTLRATALPSCAACFAYVEVRQQWDEDGEDPDYPNEPRHAAAVQVGKQRGEPSGQASITVWDNGYNLAEGLPPEINRLHLATVPLGTPLQVWFESQETSLLVHVLWDDEHYIIYVTRPASGAKLKRILVNGRTSTALDFTGQIVTDNPEGFGAWVRYNKDAPTCRRQLHGTPPGTRLRITCTR